MMKAYVYSSGTIAFGYQVPSNAVLIARGQASVLQRAMRQYAQSRFSQELYIPLTKPTAQRMTDEIYAEIVGWANRLRRVAGVEVLV